MDFTVADRESRTWQKIKEQYEKELANLRVRNDGKMSETDRNFLIGQIHQIKALLALEKPGVVLPAMSSKG